MTTPAPEGISPESPEARRRGLTKHLGDLGVSERVITVLKRIIIGIFTDGFTHAGNLAYLSLVTLFPFFIVTAAIARLFGRGDDTLHALEAFLLTLPPDVAKVLEQPVIDVVEARTGDLLWFGAIVGLWTTASFIETLRAILRQAYGVQSKTPFWRYRLGAIGMIVGSVILAMAAFSFQVMLTAAEEFLFRVLPLSDEAQRMLSFARLAPAIALFGALFILFYSLTPARYRTTKCAKWPGALFVTVWWLGTTALLPRVLGRLGSYDLTYGSLAGVMIALIFFYLIGLGVVIGAELNAALAETPRSGLEEPRKQEVNKA